MAALVVHGIPNCDTVKRARAWLDGQGIAYRFHDFRKDGVDAGMLRDWLTQVPLDKLLNRRGTTWRALSPEAQAQADTEAGAIDLMCAQPALIKRPVLRAGDRVLVGFDAQAYQDQMEVAR